MKKYPTISFGIFLVLFWLIILPLSYIGYHQVALMMVGLLIGIVYKLNPLLSITFFVYMLPLSDLISGDFNLFAYIGIREISIIAFLFYMLTHKNKSENLTLNNLQKHSIILFVLVNFILIYSMGKGVLLGLNDFSWGYLFKTVFKAVILVIPVVYLITRINSRFVQEYVIAGIFWSILTVGLLMPFTEVFARMGFVTGVTSGVEGYRETLRYMGFYGAGGDQNSAGVFCVIGLGIFIAIFEKDHSTFKKVVAVLIATIFGLVFSSSRTAMIGFGLIGILFVFRNRVRLNVLFILLSGVLVSVILTSQLKIAASRFRGELLHTAMSQKGSGRVKHLITYKEFILKHPDTIVLGNLEKIHYERAPHNYFVKVLYSSGLFVLIIIGYHIFKLLIVKSPSRFSPYRFYMLLPFLLILLTSNSAGAGVYIWLVIGQIIFNNRHLHAIGEGPKNEKARAQVIP